MVELTQISLDEFSRKKRKPNAKNFPNVKLKETKRKRPDFPPIAPENLSSSYFVSATYNGKTKKTLLKLYEPNSQQIYFWEDNSGHLPYCLTNLTPQRLSKMARLVHHSGFSQFQIIEKIHPLLDKWIKVTKIVAKDPLAIGGQRGRSIREIIPEEFSKNKGVGEVSERLEIW